jgi:hypothetical protein
LAWRSFVPGDTKKQAVGRGQWQFSRRYRLRHRTRNHYRTANLGEIGYEVVGQGGGEFLVLWRSHRRISRERFVSTPLGPQDSPRPPISA